METEPASEREQRRAPSGTVLFVKGQSGNPRGRPRKDAALRQLERVTREQAAAVLERLAGPALKVLERAMKGKDEALAVKAAVDILDRTQGKAIQKIDATLTNTDPVVTVSPEMLKLAAMRLLAANADDVEVARDRAG